MIDSSSYGWQMQQLKNEGYIISVVNSCVTEGIKSEKGILRYEIVGTYQAERVDGTDAFNEVSDLVDKLLK